MLVSYAVDKASLNNLRISCGWFSLLFYYVSPYGADGRGVDSP